MRELNVREMRASIGRLDALVDASGELVLTRNGRPIARILPVQRKRVRPDHADLRARASGMATSSAKLIRAERDER